MAYGTIANLKLRLGVTGSGDDTLLTALLASASEQVDRIAGRTWTDGSATRRYGYTDGVVSRDLRWLYLDAPLTALTSITNGDGDVLTSTEYVLLPRNETNKQIIELTTESGLWWSFDSDNDGQITVVSTAWVVPVNVIEAAYVIAEALYRRGEEAAISYEQALKDARSLVAPPSLGVL